MTETLNGAPARRDSLLTLADRLPDPVDRDSYAELVVWLRGLPPEDEMVKLAQLLGFLILIGHELPGALAAEAGELRKLIQTNATYHRTLHGRLSKLPQEIASGVDLDKFAEAMSESFRQQLAATGLEGAAQLLNGSVLGLRKLSTELAESVKPLTSQYASIGATASAELTKLTNASTQLRDHNAQLAAQAREARWYWHALFCLLLVCLGFFIGLSFEKRGTTDGIADLQDQLIRIQQKLTKPAPVPETVTRAPRRRPSAK